MVVIVVVVDDDDDDENNNNMFYYYNVNIPLQCNGYNTTQNQLWHAGIGTKKHNTADQLPSVTVTTAFHDVVNTVVYHKSSNAIYTRFNVSVKLKKQVRMYYGPGCAQQL